MKIRCSNSFLQNFSQLPKPIQKILIQQLRYLAEDIEHPKVRAKPLKGTFTIWEGWIDHHHKFTFQTRDDLIELRKVGSHDMLLIL
jgi:mRNA-degrading endonuclease YafQ of YafQ-DinJ toxin-antitoxin module